MKKRVGITLALALVALAPVCAQEGWEITPETGMVVNKDHHADDVKIGFKAGVGIYHEIKPAQGTEKPAFGIRSGLFVVQQRGGYHPMASGNIPVGGGYYMQESYDQATRYYLQLPIMARWDFTLADEIRLSLAVGPYAAIGLGGKAELGYHAQLMSSDAPEGAEEWKYVHHDFDPFKGKQVNEDFRIDASPRFDWGGTASASMTVRQWSFTIGYDIAFGNTFEQQNDLQVRNHMVSFTFGYTL